MTDTKTSPSTSGTAWTRIPDGIRVRLRDGGQEGIIDGLTQLVVGPRRNPDGCTQYRVNTGDAMRLLAVDDELEILTDQDGLVMSGREQAGYRTLLTQRLQAAIAADRFVPQKAGASGRLKERS